VCFDSVLCALSALAGRLVLRGWIRLRAWQFCAVGGDAASCGGGGDGTRILIKGGTVVNAHRAEEADVYIEDGIVVAVRPNIPVSCLIAYYAYARLIGSESVDPSACSTWFTRVARSVALLPRGATLLRHLYPCAWCA